MQCYFRKLHSFQFKALHQFRTEVQARSRCSHSAFMLCINSLVTGYIIRFSLALYIFGKRCVPQLINKTFEFIMGAVIQETQCASARGGVVYYFSNQCIILSEV